MPPNSPKLYSPWNMGRSSGFAPSSLDVCPGCLPTSRAAVLLAATSWACPTPDTSAGANSRITSSSNLPKTKHPLVFCGPNSPGNELFIRFGLDLKFRELRDAWRNQTLPWYSSENTAWYMIHDKPSDGESPSDNNKICRRFHSRSSHSRRPDRHFKPRNNTPQFLLPH